MAIKEMTNIDQLIDRVLRPYFYLIKEWGHNSLTDSVKLAKALKVAVDELKSIKLNSYHPCAARQVDKALEEIEKIAGGG